MATRLSRANGTLMEDYEVYSDTNGKWWTSNDRAHNYQNMPPWATGFETRQRPSLPGGPPGGRLVLSTLPPVTIPRPPPVPVYKPNLNWTVEMRWVLNELMEDLTLDTLTLGEGNDSRRRIFMTIFSQAYIDAGFTGLPDFQHLHGQWTNRIARKARTGVKSRPVPQGWTIALTDPATLPPQDLADRAEWGQRIADAKTLLGIP